eukprot:s6370_g2.t1
MLQVDTQDIEQRLRQQGAKSGNLQFSLSWDTKDDLDLHVITPGGREIWFQNKVSPCGGELDVDMNRSGSQLVVNPVENIVWPRAAAPVGEYKVFVNLYAARSPGPVSFKVRVSNQGSVSMFSGSVCSWSSRKVHVKTVSVQKILPPLHQDFGALFGGSFQIELTVLRVRDKQGMRTFTARLLSSLGACHEWGAFRPEQLQELQRMKKMLDRMDDVQNFAAERANAARVLHSCLAKLEMDEGSLRAAFGTFASDDASNPSLVKLEFCKRVTSRRLWFEHHAKRIAEPMGVAVMANQATGHFGRTGHNGVVLVGKPAATLLAAALIAKTSEAALSACTKSDENSFCANFVKQLGFTDSSDGDAKVKQLALSRTWLQHDFGLLSSDASWNKPKAHRHDTPTAMEGRSNGLKWAWH